MTNEVFTCNKNSTLFDAQNAGNRISELLDFKFFWGSMPPEPPKGKAPCSLFSSHSRLLHLQYPLATKVIETHAAAMSSEVIVFCNWTSI